MAGINASESPHVVNVGLQLDAGPWGLFQKTVMIYVALAFAVDGLANQVLGLAIPSLIKDWGLPRTVFASVAALGLVGVGIGAATGGIIGDRYGRRLGLLASIFLFGVMTAVTAYAHGVAELTVLRFIAGLGLGSTIPNATSLVAEVTPVRRRSFAVTIALIGIPLGSFGSGLIAADVLPAHGWRMFFAISGIVPVILAAILLIVLPESPRYLLRRSKRRPELVKLMGRLGYRYTADAILIDELRAGPKSSKLALFGPETRRDTLALWGAFFFCLMAMYTVFNWAPVMLMGQGFPPYAPGIAMSAFNFGGIAGAAFGAWVIYRYGSRTAAISIALLGALGAAALAIAPVSAAGGLTPLIISFALESFFIGGFQNLLYPVAAHLYPPFTKATGVGAASAAGRFGAVVSSFTGVMTLEYGGASGYFAFLAVIMTGGLICVALIKNHIPSIR